MRLIIAILAGDGIGAEVTHEATNILRSVAEFGAVGDNKLRLCRK
jgi:3-isopropylmalate dehydrogenase